MKHSAPALDRNHLVRLLTSGCLLISAWPLLAQPTIVSTVPENMALGVAPTAPIVFTFSEAMNTSLTSAQFMDAATYQFLATSPAWSAGNTVLTCTPVAPLPANHGIVWLVDGKSAGGAALGGTTAGMFTTAGAASTGCDTNALMLSLTVAKGWLYTQTSAAAPVPDPSAPYCFLACLSLPCPRDATDVSLRLPTGLVPNMTGTTIPGHLTLPDCSYTNQAAFEAAYPSGNYTFSIQSVTSNQQVTLNFPSTLVQPAAPHLTNLVAAQSVNPAQPFTLGWDPLPGGTVADCVYVEIYGGVFKTPDPGVAGGLNGTATGVVFPAGTFQPNQSYSGIVNFYHFLLATNGNAYVSLMYRASGTEFGLSTTGGSASPLVLTNAGWAGAGTFAFEVTCSSGQALVAEYCTKLASNQWRTLCSTNSTSQRVRFTDPGARTNAQLFYRVRTGP